MHKILIIEDQKLVLDGIANTVAADKSFAVAGKLTDAAHALDFLKKTAADLILSDICTENGSNFLDFISPIKKAYPDIKIIVMTGLPEISFLKRAKEAGADAFIYKNISSDEMLNLLKSTLGGYNVFPNRTKDDYGLGSLTNRELEVLRLVCDGTDHRKDIAQELGVSEISVKNCISGILSKTGFSSVAQLAVFAVGSGLILPRA